MSRLILALCLTAATAIVASGLYLILGKAAPMLEHRQAASAPAPIPVETPRAPPAQQTAPQPAASPGGSATIYRCNEGGSTVYSDQPCKGGRVVDVQTTQGFNGQRSVQQAAVVPQSQEDRATSPSASRLAPPAATSNSAMCEQIEKAIAAIDAAARAGGTIAQMEYLKEERRKLVERRQALVC